MQAGMLSEAKFAAIDDAGWRALAQKAIGAADFAASLVSHTDDGIAIDPLHVRRPGPEPLPRARAEPGWHVVQRIDDTDPVRANAQALDDIANGATGLAVVFDGAPNAFGYGLPASAEALNQALDGVPLHKTHLRIDVHPASRSSVDWIVALLGARRHDPMRLSLSFGIDPAATFAGTGRLRMSIEALRASMPQSLAHFFALGVPGVLLEADGRVFHNGGATEAQELGAMLSAAVSHLRMFEEARQPLVYAAPHIGFALSVDQDQLLSMAKLRALRKLWARVQEACSIEPSPCAIHAETSSRMLTTLDPETNILRNTIAAFAAAAGGADSISVLPHTLTHGLPAPFARRVARNTQLLLRDESHVGFVEDPAAGSGGVETLTDSLCESAWAEFRRLEGEGGVLESLAAGKIQSRIADARAARIKTYREDKRSIVGTTLYRLKEERPVETLAAERHPMPTDGLVFCEKLPLHRLDSELAGASA